jgi:hypothetical protein
MVALVAAGLMPGVLIAISAVLESVMVPRYAIVSVLLAAPLIALASESLGRVGRGLLMALFVALLVRRADRDIAGMEYFDAVTRKYASHLATLKGESAPIVFQTYFLMYPVEGRQRRESFSRLLELPDSTIDALFPGDAREPREAKLRLDRNQARLHSRVFGFPIPVTQAQLDGAPRFYLFARNVDLTAGFTDAVALGQRIFPRHRGVRVNEYVTLFTRTQ